MSAWFASERWAFARHKGQKWLSDVLSDVYDHVMTNPLVSGLNRRMVAIIELVRSWNACIRHFFNGVSRWRSVRASRREGNDPETCSSFANMVVDVNNGEDVKSPFRKSSDITLATRTSEQLPTTMSSNRASSGVQDPVYMFDGDDSIPVPTVGKQLWKTAIRHIKIQNAISGKTALSTDLSSPTSTIFDTIVDSPRSSVVFGGENDESPKPIRKRTTSSGLGRNMPERRRTTMELPVSARSKMNIMASKLSELVVKYDLAPHTALVRHMQFSPDGKFLATASWDKTCVIFRVGVSIGPILQCITLIPFHSHHFLPTAYWHMLKVSWDK